MLAARKVARPGSRPLATRITRPTAQRSVTSNVTRSSGLRVQRPSVLPATQARFMATGRGRGGYDLPDFSKDEELRKVWEDIEKLDDLYDPRLDNDFPESEYGEFDFPFEDFLANLTGANRLPPRTRESMEDLRTLRDDKPIRASNDTFTAVNAGHTSGTPKSAKRLMEENESMLSRQKIGSVTMPQDLVSRVAQLARGVPKNWLVRDAQRLSEALRARVTESVPKKSELQTENKNESLPESPDLEPQNDNESQSETGDLKLKAPVAFNKQQCIAYVAHFFPGIYACNLRVFSEIQKRLPQFKPRKMIDFGSGPGTSVWAAARCWPAIKRYILVEPSDAMIEVSTQLLEGFPVERRRFLFQGRQDPVDLVVASYSLSELTDPNVQRAHLRALWNALNPGGILVILEPGTPVGFKIVRAARSLILDLKSEDESVNPVVVGPCTHNKTCPLDPSTWCHFTQRVQHSSAIRSTKKGKRNYENIKFSWVAISKGPIRESLPPESSNAGLTPSRIIRAPMKRGGHVYVDFCHGTGTTERVIIARSRGKDAYKAARKSSWGDLFYYDRVPKKKPVDPERRQLLKERKKERADKWKQKKHAQKRIEMAQMQRAMATQKPAHVPSISSILSKPKSQ